MRNRFSFGIGLLLALSGALAEAAGTLEIVTLRYRSAESVVPLLQPFLDPGGSLSGRGDKLFVRTSPGNFDELRRLLDELDRARRQLRLTVTQDVQTASAQGAAGVRADLPLGNNVRILSGSVPPGSSLEVRGGGAAVSIGGGDTLRTQRQGSEQSVQVLEGERAFIQIGQAVPVPTQQVIVRPGGAVVTQTTQYRDLGQGFYAQPTLAGDRVSVDIAQQDARPGGYGPGSAEVSRVATTVSGRLGEWISLGGIDQQVRQSASSGFSYATRDATRQQGLWLKVEVIGE